MLPRLPSKELTLQYRLWSLHAPICIIHLVNHRGGRRRLWVCRIGSWYVLSRSDAGVMVCSSGSGSGSSLLVLLNMHFLLPHLHGLLYVIGT